METVKLNNEDMSDVNYVSRNDIVYYLILSTRIKNPPIEFV